MILKAQGIRFCIRKSRHLHNKSELGGGCHYKSPLPAGGGIRHHMGWRHERTATAMPGPPNPCVWSPGEHISLRASAERDLNASRIGTAGRSTFTTEVKTK